ncbi:TraR/DksA C4-type zinc finger protein [Candidatus Nomurabacteria bacterium]|nr:TraR/DksA C4-type zinc finger protein [Candidatus Nomurabacteria bacterium]
MTKYINKLNEEKKNLEVELSSIAKYDDVTNTWYAVPESQTAPEADENDMASRSEDFEERSAIVDTLGRRLKDIKDAMQRIEEKKFGKCETCGDKIEEERLEVNPSARKCMICMNLV